MYLENQSVSDIGPPESHVHDGTLTDSTDSPDTEKTTYGATKHRPTYTGGQLIENHIFYMTTYRLYIHTIIIQIESLFSTHLQITCDSLFNVLFVKSNF
jgi:hypothetical protein